MRTNESTVLIGRNLIFVPYKKHHVEKYHKWMQDVELLEKTASEPLSLEEEYEMQQRWWEDDDKCTFILLNQKYCTCENDIGKISSESLAMAGDVNLFFNNVDNNKEAEVEVMIAEKNMRGQGLGREAVQTMMYYGYKILNVQTYTVKIGYSNNASINMFKKLGFTEVSRTDVFEEITFSLDCCTDNFKTKILDVVEPTICIKSDYNIH